MAALVERHVLAGAIGGIVGCMAVVRGHCVPEGSYCTCEADGFSIQHDIDDSAETGRLTKAW